MNNVLYPRLAFTNMGKHKKLYLPYILSAVITIGMFYIMNSLQFNKDMHDVKGGSVLTEIFPLGIIVIGIFSLIFILYTNNFLMKQRTMELGLYNVLGMEKKHIAKIILFETLYSLFFSLAGGLGFGILFDKLSTLLLAKLIKLEVPIGFHISLEAIIITAAFFTAVFFINFLRNFMTVKRSNPIELLHGSSTGEKEPKTKILAAVFGALFLAAGYAIALLIQDPLQAILMYFVAVICVIIGTYLLFLSGSIAVLKLLRKNKKYYYNKKHFTTVSGLLYRMKQNAVGLANICILSTMVLVTVSATVALYAGTEYSINKSYPRDIQIDTEFNNNYDEKIVKQTTDCIKQYLADKNLTPKNILKYDNMQMRAYLAGADFDTDPLPTGNDPVLLYLITAEGYKNLTGENAVLKNNEVLLLQNDDSIGDSFRIFNKEYKVVRHLDSFAFDPFSNTIMINYKILVVSDRNEMLALREKYDSSRKADADPTAVTAKMMFDIDGTEEEKIAIYKNFYTALSDFGLLNDDDHSFSIQSKQDISYGFYQVYGSLFFLGIMLGTLFLMVTVMIIYYKQISEGYADRKRFEIMQKVGMSDREVKKSIHSQVLTVFFLPLITAFIHLAFSFPLTAKVLQMLQNADIFIFVLGLAGTAVVFAAIYTAVYLMTARTYYKIISK